MYSGISRAFILVALFAAVGGCPESEGQQPPDAGVKAAEKQASAIAGEKGLSAAQVRDLSALVDRVVAGADVLPRAEFDPATLAKHLGKEPEAHFKWVRDHTWWAPYRGLLRGSQGVMLDRVGSSLDRAVLLGDLLRRAGYNVRLAGTELPVERARQLLSQVRPIPAGRRTPEWTGPALAHKDRVSETSMPQDSESARTRYVKSRRAAVEASALVRTQTETLLTSLQDSSTPADEANALAALKDHWWVEYENDVDDKWHALDVLLPDAKAGFTLAPATTTVAWTPTEDAPSIPDSDWHSVGLRVVIERYEAGATKELTVLATTIRPAQTLDKPIALVHVPMPWPNEVAFPGADPGVVREAVLQISKWVPVLLVAGDQFIQAGFTNTGELEEPLANSSSVLGTGRAVSGMDMALGGFGEGEVTVATTAEWMDYEINVPGESTQRLRRTVFDLLGPARRAVKFSDFEGGGDLPILQRAEALLSRIEILLQPCDFTGPFVADLTSASIVANQATIKDIAREPESQKAKAMASALLERMDFWGTLPTYVRWRSALNGQSHDWFVDRPNVLNYRISQRLLGVEQIAVRGQMDVVANGVGARSAAGRQAFETRVRQGVADTVAEMLALGSDFRTSANAASVFSRLAVEGSRGFVIKARDVAAVKRLPWPEDEIERVAADVNAGYQVFVPRQAVEIEGEPQVAWWRVDPASGATIGVMGSGLHGDDAEYPLTNIYSRQELTQGKMKNWPRWNNLENKFRQDMYKMSPDEMWELQFSREVSRTLEYMIGLGL
jgi:hypothetical protein